MRTTTNQIHLACIIIGFLSCTLSAQQITDDMLLLNDAHTSIYSNPNYGIKVSEVTLNDTTEPVIKCKSLYLLAKSYYIKGYYKEAYKNLVSAYTIANNENYEEDKENINILIADVLNALRLYESSNTYLNKTITSKSEDATIKWIKAKTLQNEGNLNLLKDSTIQIGYSKLLEAKQLFKSVKDKNVPDNLTPIQLDLARYHTNNLQLDSSSFYLQNLNSKHLGNNNYITMHRLEKEAEILFLKREFSAAIDTLNKGLMIADKFNNIHLKNSITKKLVSNYLVLNNNTQFLNYNQKLTVLNNESNLAKNDALNTVLNYTKINKNNTVLKLEEHYKRINIILSVLLIIALGLGLTLKRIRKKRIKQYLDILKYFEISKNEDTPVTTHVASSPTQVKSDTANPKLQTTTPPKTIETKTAVMPKETEDIIITKLKHFEKSNRFTSKDMSLGQLASKLDTNTKYLSEVINKTKGKNFNAYINELRIKYIIEKLKTNPQYLNYKVSYLAEESGFSSHSSFATVFKSVTGLSPTVFINIIKKEFTT